MTRLPLLTDPTLIPAVHKDLGPSAGRHFAHPAIAATLHLGWAMTVAGLRGAPHHAAAAAVADDDEATADLALDARVFHLLPVYLLAHPSVAKEEFYQRRLHALITDFIVLMPLKVKELRNRADDAARNSLMHEQATQI